MKAIKNGFKCPHCHKEIDPGLIYSHIASIGGRKNRLKGSEHFSKIGKLGSDARWGKKKV